MLVSGKLYRLIHLTKRNISVVEKSFKHEHCCLIWSIPTEWTILNEMNTFLSNIFPFNLTWISSYFKPNVLLRFEWVKHNWWWVTVQIYFLVMRKWCTVLFSIISTTLLTLGDSVLNYHSTSYTINPIWFH